MLQKLFAPYVVGVASRVIGQVISFLVVAIASRNLGLEDFGTYAVGWALCVIATTFVFTGLYQALLRTTEFENDCDTLFWANGAVGAAGMVVILIVGLVSGGLTTTSGQVLIALSPIPLLHVPPAWWEAQLVRDQRVRAASVYVLIAEFSGLVAAIALFSLGWGVSALVAARWVVSAVGILQTGTLVRRLPKLRFDRAALRKARATAFPLWGTTSVGLTSNYAGDLVLGAFASPALVGAYRGGARIAMTASDLVLQPLGVLSWSRFTRIEKNKEGVEALRLAWLENMSLAAALLWPIATAVALLAPALVVTLLDETWLPAASIVAILSVSKSIGFFSALLEPTMLTTDRPRLQLYIRGTGAVALVLLLLVFGRLGPEIAAFCHLTANVIVGGWALVAMAKALGLAPKRILMSFLPGLSLSAITYGAVLATTGQWGRFGTELGLGLTIAAVAVVWGVVMLVFLRRGVLVLPTP